VIEIDVPFFEEVAVGKKSEYEEPMMLRRQARVHNLPED